MIVQCPSCHTRYRTDSSHIADETTRFQCTREGCNHVFFYSPPLLEGIGQNSLATGSGAPNQPSTSSSTPEDIFTIPSEDAFSEEEPVLHKPLATFAASDQYAPFRTGEEPALTKPLEPLGEELFDQSEISDAFVPAEPPFYADAEAAEEEQRSGGISSSAWSKPGATISPGVFLVFLGSLVFSFGGLGIYCFYHSEKTEAVLSRIPILSSLIAGERFSAQHIILSDLNGHYQLTKDNQKVFTVSGVATNNATIPARTIQLEGAIYDVTGKIIGQRVIFCGTNIAPERLANLTLREIGALQDLVPPKQFHVSAGSAVKFLIVFPSHSSAIAEFSGRVVTAQFDGG